MEDFSKAKYTAIVSDLHLCEEEPVNTKFPLWKKYKTRDFFFDDDFETFLVYLQKRSKPHPVELILAGDIFDFDSVTSMPEAPVFRITWLERKRGLHPQEEKSVYKINRVLDHHPKLVNALRQFVLDGNRAIFILGNHDLELHFKGVQKAILNRLSLPDPFENNIRFNEWFYVSNGDTLIEHGNQYDPYCVAQDPVNPFVLKYNRIEVRLPFGNLTTRYMINGMGFFNPHVDSNFIMSMGEYVRFFLKYVVRAQPLLMMDWFWGATAALLQTFVNRLRPSVRDPLTIEDTIEKIAMKANASPRMVRELKELFVSPAASNPFLIAQELWLDRAFIVLSMFAIIFLIFLIIKVYFQISFFWMFFPLFGFLPFFIFYSTTVKSGVHEFKEPQEDKLALASYITKVNRIVYGHTHIARHEVIGTVEHLNSGTWSPAFLDVECTKSIDAKTFVWIEPGINESRVAKLFQFEQGRVREVFSKKPNR